MADQKTNGNAADVGQSQNDSTTQDPLPWLIRNLLLKQHEAKKPSVKTEDPPAKKEESS